MLRLLVILILLFTVISCTNSDSNTAVVDNRISPPEPDKDLREKYEAQNKQAATACVFDNPDTSVSNIRLRDAESARKVLDVNKLNGDTTYYFLSKDKSEILGVKVYPGDNYSQVSIYKVVYANVQHKAAPSRIEYFKTEKGIRLGLTKNEVVARLGNCYTTIDSTPGNLTINYRLESPQDSRTNLLERQNMPIYFAAYKFKNDKLSEYEFGFEYP